MQCCLPDNLNNVNYKATTQTKTQTHAVKTAAASANDYTDNNILNKKIAKRLMLLL